MGEPSWEPSEARSFLFREHSGGRVERDAHIDTRATLARWEEDRGRLARHPLRLGTAGPRQPSDGRRLSP
jgi:hypothetical protein